MNRKIAIIFSALFLLQMTACLQEERLDAPQAQDESVPAIQRKAVNTSEDAVEGTLVVLLSEDASSALENGQEVTSLVSACAQTGATLQRAFPFNGTDHERKYRMDRWYLLTFPADTDVREVAEIFAELPEISVVEYNTRLARLDESEATAWVAGDNSVSPSLPFNDPKLIDQWHYINYGDLSVASTVRVGADINVRDAWKLTTGDPEIIVAICDEGVKYDHPDLAPNMWVNEKEKNGEEGVDDDGNGYIDDIHGYNFLSTYNKDTKEGEVMPVTWDRPGDNGHGTHVAGTVAAVNNNGIGVCGVAGGDGTPGTGIRMMTCQLFSGNASGGTLNRAQAYRYAADMGASILQCSFGQDAGNLMADKDFETMYRSEVDALEYFMTKRAASNPVSCNFAIFASGNEGQDVSAYPAAHNRYISVAAFGPDFLPTNYTNYGPGVNICAPGGDYAINSTSATPERSQILSTLPKELGKSEYGYMQGTSMACPHVSGIVALALSYAKKLGKTFTYEEFLGMLYTSVNNIDYYIETCSKYNNGVLMDLTPFWHNMGTGAIDTWRLLMQIEGTPCLPVQKGTDVKIALDQFFSPAASHLTFTKVEVSDEARAALGIVGDPYVKYGKLFIRCENEGSAKISISAIAGGSEVAGQGNAVMGGTEFTREISILSRTAGVSENGGWL